MFRHRVTKHPVTDSVRCFLKTLLDEWECHKLATYNKCRFPPDNPVTRACLLNMLQGIIAGIWFLRITCNKGRLFAPALFPALLVYRVTLFSRCGIDALHGRKHFVKFPHVCLHASYHGRGVGYVPGSGEVVFCHLRSKRPPGLRFDDIVKRVGSPHFHFRFPSPGCASGSPLRTRQTGR